MKLEGWRGFLCNVIVEYANRPFVWGSNDCVLFAANCYQAMTGVDPLPEFRGTYFDRDTAVQRMKEYAGGGLREAALKRLGKPDNGDVEDGDILLIENPIWKEDMLGVSADGFALAVGRKKLVKFPAYKILASWKI